MDFKVANYCDFERVSLLQANSLKSHYGGILSDQYLANEVSAEKLLLWQTRLTNPPFGQHIVLAEEGGLLLGFICAFGNHDFELGTYIDSLYVDDAFQHRGIGSQLLKQIAEWHQHYFSDKGLYLQVSESNTEAIDFYLHMGGKVADIRKREDLSGEIVVEKVITWPNADALTTGLAVAFVHS
ncbi:GNAT family N-acetyltransferase [Vibrio sp. IRLE0018]|uniref:GNAT family N-acetyltransferase n=1 Tax=Vibrio floridensis TaxID=2908007 RepID=UPI001A3550AA|nr:GNAT family N-acetyltransferase [Vibrio floridensis]MCF8777730.1 GNAT family N-acetyltransferase [Vibrio floridensis]HAS6346880.1 GNAT family N-acetyltransferase [Vibrio vulnificus]